MPNYYFPYRVHCRINYLSPKTASRLFSSIIAKEESRKKIGKLRMKGSYKFQKSLGGGAGKRPRKLRYIFLAEEKREDERGSPPPLSLSCTVQVGQCHGEKKKGSFLFSKTRRPLFLRGGEKTAAAACDDGKWLFSRIYLFLLLLRLDGAVDGRGKWFFLSFFAAAHVRR